MNEFTKQELIDLHCSLYGGVNDDHPVANHLIVLQNKIQSMIDNYCEHENIVSYNGAECVYWCMDCSVVKGAI